MYIYAINIWIYSGIKWTWEDRDMEKKTPQKKSWNVATGELLRRLRWTEFTEVQGTREWHQEQRWLEYTDSVLVSEKPKVKTEKYYRQKKLYYFPSPNQPPWQKLRKE